MFKFRPFHDHSVDVEILYISPTPSMSVLVPPTRSWRGMRFYVQWVKAELLTFKIFSRFQEQTKITLKLYSLAHIDLSKTCTQKIQQKIQSSVPYIRKNDNRSRKWVEFFRLESTNFKINLLTLQQRGCADLTFIDLYIYTVYIR
jgi:hypothetical protein